MTVVPPSAWTRLGDSAAGILPKIARVNRLGDKVHKGAPLLRSDSVAELYGGMLSLWRDPEGGGDRRGRAAARTRPAWRRRSRA